MRTRLIVVWLLVLVANVRAGSPQDYRRALLAGTHYSLSRQFIIHDPPFTEDYYYRLDESSNLTRLDPTLLAVSCERIKTALLKTLGARDEWQGKIFLDLHLGRHPDEAILVTPTLFGDQWRYRIELPDLLDRSRLVAAVVEVLLLEMANRQTDHCAEIPAWLTQGLTREVMLSSQIELVVEPPRNSEKGVHLVFSESAPQASASPQKSENGARIEQLLRSGRLPDQAATLAGAATASRPPTYDEAQMKLAHEDLRALPSLTLEELSWPGDGQLDGPAGEAFRSSAQLFVHELLQLPDGRASLQALVKELPRHLNWQISFLNAFHTDFSSQLELEKWWTLHVVQFTGRDLNQTWPSAQSWQKLDEIVRPSVQIRAGADDLPAVKQVTLGAIIQDWDFSHQAALLQEKSQQLLLLRHWVSQDFVSLVDDYRRVLDAYVRKRSFGVTPQGRTANPGRLDPLAREALLQLETLEARREELRPKPESPQPVAVTAPINSN